MMKKLTLLILTCMSAVLAAQESEMPKIEITRERIADAKIEVREAQGGTLQMKTCVMGKAIVNPNRHAHVVAPRDGVVKNVMKNLGDMVKAGDILAVFESRDVADAKAAYLSALRKESYSESLFKREKELHDKKISAAQDYLSAEADYQAAQIDTQLALQKLFAMGINEEEVSKLGEESSPQLRLAYLRAPIEGTIIHRDLTKGEFIPANQQTYIIADLRNIWVEMGIYPKDLQVIKQGQMIEITSDTLSKPVEARIVYVSPVIDPDTHTAKAIAEVDNRGKIWRPGSYVCASITTEVIQAAVMVNNDAVLSMGGKDVVFVKVQDGFEQRPVTVGHNDGVHIEIVAGLNPGEEYAATNTFILKSELSKTGEE